MEARGEFMSALLRLGDREIANGDYVTLDRYETHSIMMETIQCFSGVIITRTLDKHANNAKTIIQGLQDRREIGEDAGRAGAENQ